MLNCWTKTNALKGNTEVPLVASKDVGLEIMLRKFSARGTFRSCQQNAGQNHDMKVAKNPF